MASKGYALTGQMCWVINPSSLRFLPWGEGKKSTALKKMCGVGASKREREKGTLCCSLSGTLTPFSSTFPLHFRPVSPPL